MKAKTIAALAALTAGAGAAAGGAYLKRKNICPLCVAKKLIAQTPLHVTATKHYDNGVALTPPMGWSSWNTMLTGDFIWVDQCQLWDTAEDRRADHSGDGRCHEVLRSG